MTGVQTCALPISKRAHAHALHLAGVLHIAEHAPDHFRAQVSGETMGRVLRAMTEYFLPTAVDVLELLGARPGDRLVDQLLTKQRRWWAEGKKTCTERDLYRAAGINPKDLVEPLSELIDCGALVPPPAPPPGPRGAGRPPAPFYWLNPALGGAA